MICLYLFPRRERKLLISEPHGMSSNHGGNIIAMAKALGCHVSALRDMSSNLTPLGPPPGLKEVLTAGLEEIVYLPETGSETLQGLFALRHGLDRQQVLVGNGSTEFIFGLPGAVDAQRSVIVSPTYSDYIPASEWAGLRPERFFLRLEENFVFDHERLAQELRGKELVFVCNPNNPTGSLIPTLELLSLVERLPDSLFVVDESYLPFTNECSLLDFPLPHNLFVLTSFSKIFGIPGLRLGFLVSSAANLQIISQRRKPWGVNRLAQLAGAFLLEHGASYAAQVRAYVQSQRSIFTAALDALPGVRSLPGAANFILCLLEDGIRAPRLRERLLQDYRIMVRDCSDFVGLDDRFFRVSLLDEAGNSACIKALGEILGSSDRPGSRS